MATLALVGIGGAAVLHPLSQYTVVAALVCQHGSSDGQGSVLPVRGQQLGQHLGLVELSHGHRTAAAVEEGPLAVASLAVVGGLWTVAFTDPPLCLGGRRDPGTRRQAEDWPCARAGC